MQRTVNNLYYQIGKLYVAKDISLTDRGTFRFDADQWIEHPSDYSLLDLEGTLRGEVLSGDSPTPFTVTKTDRQATDMGWKQAYRDYIVQDIEKTAHNESYG